MKPEATQPQDPAPTPVATSLGLPGMIEQPQTPALSSPVPETPSTPPSPSTSTTTMSDFTIADNLDELNRSSNLKLSLTIHSTSRTEVLKCYVAKPSFVSTRACGRSILLSFVKCFHLQISLLPSLQTGAHALCPPTYQLILQLS